MDRINKTEKLAQVAISSQDNGCPNQIRFVVKLCVEGWESIRDQDIVIKDVAGGMTNYLYSASLSDSAKQQDNKPNVCTALVRIYGNQTELIIDRQRELKNISSCYEAGFGPKVYGIFKNGYIYEFFPGRPISPEELFKCTWNARIGEAVARWHKQTCKDQSPAVWQTIENWLSIVPETYPNPAQDKIWKSIGGMKKVKEELQVLKDMALAVKSPVVLGHNDLLGGNIIVNEENGSIKFIDFEYASSNYQAFDIANHFNEFAGFEADYSRYPSKDQQYQFLAPYLTEYNGKPPTEEELLLLYRQVNKFALVSHVFWGAWSLVQGAISKIDFDFVAYAAQRFDEYFKRKEEFLSM